VILALELDPTQKKTLEELFHVSTRVPELGLGAGNLAEDANAVFRIAKEFDLRGLSAAAGGPDSEISFTETKPVKIEDVLRSLRFICWLFSYYFGSPRTEGDLDRAQPLKSFFASVVMQAQTQRSDFEELLRHYGIERQLESSTRPREEDSPPISRKHSRPGSPGEIDDSRIQLEHVRRTQQVSVKISAAGTELTSTVHEAIWKAQGPKRNKPH
jgi:hypothetical protein